MPFARIGQPPQGGPRRESALSKDRALEGLRRRCLSRARQQRCELIQRSRQDGGGADAAAAALETPSLHGIVASELRSAAAGWSAADWSAADRDYVDIMAALEQQLLRDLEADVASLVEDEYLAYESSEEARLQQLLASDSAHGADAVLCPLCYQGYLNVSTEGCIECSSPCPLRIDARGHPAPLELLRERMCSLLQQHGCGCDGIPSCRLPSVSERSLGMLVLSCERCGLLTGVV